MEEVHQRDDLSEVISQLEFESNWENLLNICLSLSSLSEKQETMTVAKGHQTSYLHFPWALLKVGGICP